MTGRSFSGLRVLVVEDESMVSMLVEDMLTELGCEVAASAARIDDAMDRIATADLDVVILDVNLGGEQTDRVAALLSERGVPFVAATGYGSGDLSPAFAGAPVLHKPFQQRALEQALLAAVKGGPAAVNGRR